MRLADREGYVVFDWKESSPDSDYMFEGYEKDSCIEAWIALTPESSGDHGVTWRWESDEDADAGIVYITDQGLGYAVDEAMRHCERSAALESQSWSNR